MCKEVRDTEAAYINDLETVLDVYVRPAIERRMLTLEDTQAIFANLEELCRCATVLLELMDREGDRASILAHAFIQGVLISSPRQLAHARLTPHAAHRATD